MDFSSKLGIAKFVVSGVVGAGTKKIVTGIIEAHVTPESTKDRISVNAASWVITAMVTNATKKYTDNLIDSTASTVAMVYGKSRLAMKLGRINEKQSTFAAEGLNEADFEKNAKGRWVPKKPVIDVVVDKDSVSDAV